MTWKWGSPNKVRRFIDALCRLEMIEISAQNPTRLKIVNAERYGLVWNSKRHSDGTEAEQARNSDGTIQQVLQVKQVEQSKQKNPPAPRKRGKNLVLKPDLFAEFKSKYPDRQPPHNWSAAAEQWNARLHQGSDPADILRGAENYAAYIRDRGKEGTDLLKMASTFLGKKKHWDQFQEPIKVAADTGLRPGQVNRTDEQYNDMPDWAENRTV